MLKTSDIQILKGMIEDHRSSLMERIDHGDEYQDEVETSVNHSKSDLASDLPRQEIRNLIRKQTKQKLNQIEQASQRIEDGTYGRCAHCGESIPMPRLMTKPYAILCVICQSKHEL